MGNERSMTTALLAFILAACVELAMRSRFASRWAAFSFSIAAT